MNIKKQQLTISTYMNIYELYINPEPWVFHIFHHFFCSPWNVARLAASHAFDRTWWGPTPPRRCSPCRSSPKHRAPLPRALPLDGCDGVDGVDGVDGPAQRPPQGIADLADFSG